MNRFAYLYISTSLILIYLISTAYSQSPASTLFEESSQSFYPNGTEKSSLTGYGRLGIELPNTQDTLQYIRVNLSNNIADTNLNSRETFADVAASPKLGDQSPMYFDTAGGYNTMYTITNPGVIPKINLKLDYRNSEGGTDIHSGPENTILFNLTILADRPLDGIELYIRSKENTYAADSIILGSLQATSFTTKSTTDTDSDTYNDTIYWQGNLIAGTPVYLTFSGTTQAGVNYLINDELVELGSSSSVNATYSTPNTFTGLTITSRFSRGPIRQGLKMSFGKIVWVQGTIKNMASGLNYKLTDWAIYNVTNLTTPVSSGTVPMPQELSAGETYETPWYQTPDSEEKYFVSEFLWYVKWDPAKYRSTAASLMDLPTLYQAHGIAQKSISLVQVTPQPVLNIEDTAIHLGHSNIYFNSASVTSQVPSGWTIENVRVYYSNRTVGGNEYDITGSATTNIAGTTLTMVLSGISDIIGKPLGLNEDIIIRYTTRGPASSSSYTFTSGSTVLLNTSSGTPLTLTSSSSEEVPPAETVPEPPDTGSGGGGGGVGIPKEYFAQIIKDGAGITAQESGNSADIEATFEVLDTGTKGVGDIYAIIMLPEGSTLDPDNMSISVYNPLTEKVIVYPAEKLMIKEDTSKGNTPRYSIRIKSDDWSTGEKKLNLKNKDLYTLKYSAKLPFGSNNITTRLIGFNYYTDKEIFEEFNQYIRVAKERGYILPLEIKESEIEPQQNIVGKPPLWIKTVDVYNPNEVSVEHDFETSIFSQIMTLHITSDGDDIESHVRKTPGIEATWTDVIGPRAKKTYILYITTPPVLISEERYSVESLRADQIIFFTNITLLNPSDIDYSNITLIYPSPSGSVLSIAENNQPLEYVEDLDHMRIIIPSIKKRGNTNVVLSYVMSPPILLVDTDKPVYSPGESANISVKFIPHEAMSSSFIQLEVLDISRENETIYADVAKLTDLEKNKPEILVQKFKVPETQKGSYSVDAKATLNPFVEIRASKAFSIESNILDTKKISIQAISILALLILFMLAARLYRRKEFEDELKSLKKQIEHI